MSLVERVHVYPEGDLHEHVLQDNCWCVPSVKPEGAGFVVVHHALDGRESHEEGADVRLDS